MKKEYIPNKRLNEIFKFEINELMKKKIKKAKSTFNFKCPDIYLSPRKPQLTNNFRNNKSNYIIINDNNFIIYRAFYFKSKKLEFRN